MPSVAILEMTDPRIGTQTGIRSDKLIELRGAKAGIGVHGGYIDMSPGRYRVIIWLSKAIAAAGHGVIQVYAAKKSAYHSPRGMHAASLPVQHPFIDLTFELLSEYKDVESIKSVSRWS